MDSTPDQIAELFRESGHEPVRSDKAWQVSVKLPMAHGGVLTVTVEWDQGPDIVYVSTNGVTATHLPFVDYSDFAAMFRALLRGCIQGPAESGATNDA